MIDPAKILIIDLCELHIIHEYVAVCWNLVEQVQTVTGQDGRTYAAKVPRRACDVEDKPWNQPYIMFVNIHYEPDSPACLDEDSPVAGGISVKFAELIRDELMLAIDYLRQISERV